MVRLLLRKFQSEKGTMTSAMRIPWCVLAKYLRRSELSPELPLHYASETVVLCVQPDSVAPRFPVRREVDSACKGGALIIFPVAGSFVYPRVEDELPGLGTTAAILGFDVHPTLTCSAAIPSRRQRSPAIQLELCTPFWHTVPSALSSSLSDKLSSPKICRLCSPNNGGGKRYSTGCSASRTGFAMLRAFASDG